MRNAECGVVSASAFSLLEVMIAIVILGLGLIMVATMFPVAWDRARTLNEAATQQTITENAQAIIQNLTRVSGEPSDKNVFSSATSFEGDLQLDASGVPVRACVQPPFDRSPISATAEPPLDGHFCFNDSSGCLLTDTRVHALNLENMSVAPSTDDSRVNEKPWVLGPLGGDEDLVDKGGYDPGETEKIDPFYEATFFTPRVSVGERVFPSIGPRPVGVDGGAATPEAIARWTDRLAGSRFVWAVFHRLQSLACYKESSPDFGATRVFDMFYVTLRRPQPTNRYARQDTSSTPDPCTLPTNAVAPQALDFESDVLFPVAWRVQVKFPLVEVRRFPSKPPKPGEEPTGIPTEVEVPPFDPSSDVAAGMMFVQMFQKGTRFIDEITGQVYRVAKRRVTGNDGEKAVLTLDREVVFEDLDLPCAEVCGVSVPDPRCSDCFDTVSCPPLAGDVPTLQDQERLRTVWVFPPPVEPGHAAGVVTFVGKSPVVGISVRTLTLAPTQ